jgi:hypothetical protein
VRLALEPELGVGPVEALSRVALGERALQLTGSRARSCA